MGNCGRRNASIKTLLRDCQKGLPAVRADGTYEEKCANCGKERYANCVPIGPHLDLSFNHYDM
jgi:hypothetical protein